MTLTSSQLEGFNPITDGLQWKSWSATRWRDTASSLGSLQKWSIDSNDSLMSLFYFQHCKVFKSPAWIITWNDDSSRRPLKFQNFQFHCNLRRQWYWMTGRVYCKLVLLISLTAFLLVYHTKCKYHFINGNRQFQVPHKDKCHCLIKNTDCVMFTSFLKTFA